METFKRYCNPRKDSCCCCCFFFFKESTGGLVDCAYVTDLRNKASGCELADLKDGLIRDRIVCGVNDDTVRARLFRESELSLENCIDICRAAEISLVHFKVLNVAKCNASVNFNCALHPPPPPPSGNCGAFARLVSPGDGALANLVRPRSRAFAKAGDKPEKFVDVFKGTFS